MHNKKLICGIIMPISTIDNCNEEHWIDVKNIIDKAIIDAGFIPNIVSNADDIGVIQKRIIQNLYNNPIVVCDVSGKNPNVMFELGMRLAFDKPTIIIKDDKTSYTFDTGLIEHLEYPRDLRFSTIEKFTKKLKEKIYATHQESINNSEYTTFLHHFIDFKSSNIDYVYNDISTELSEIKQKLKEQEEELNINKRNEHFISLTNVDSLGISRDRLNMIIAIALAEFEKLPSKHKKNITETIQNTIKDKVVSITGVSGINELSAINRLVDALL